METKIENWTLYLPIGTIESERLMYLLEFLSSKSINIVYINIAPHIHSNDELKNFDKNASSEGSKRSITSTEKSLLSDDRSFSESSKGKLDVSFDFHPIAHGSSINFEKKANLDESLIDKKLSLPNVGKWMNDQTKNLVTLFYPTLQTDETHFFHNMQEICYLLLDYFGTGNKLGLLGDSRKQIQEQIQRIEEKIDPEVKRLMSFIYLNNIDPDGVIKDDVTKKVSINWNSYQLTLDYLIKELEYLYKKYLCHRTISTDSELTLADVYLIGALNRVYKFLFNPIFSKSWVSNVTSWFHKISKRKDFENAFGKFRTCKINYTSLLRNIDSNSELKEDTPEIEVSAWKMEDLKLHFKELNEKLSVNSVLDQNDMQVVQKINFEGFKGDNFYLWIFTYIPIDEDYRSRKNSNKTQDETSVFYDTFCSEAQNNTNDFLLYVVLHSKCENLQGFVNTKRNFEPCKTHFGNYFVNSEIKGLVITKTKDLPQFMSQYEQKDILEVKYVEKEQNLVLENMLQRKGEFLFEIVLNERIF